MKKISFISIGAVLAAVMFGSCVTTSLNDVTSEIKSEKLVINTMVEKKDITILKTITKTSDFVYWNPETEIFEGDTFKYGYINEPENVVVGEGQAISIGKKARSATKDAAEIAKLNANYQLIEEAYELGADSIFEPVYTVENNKEWVKGKLVKDAYKVTVRAMVIQIKK